MDYRHVPSCPRCRYSRSPVDKGPLDKCGNCGASLDLTRALQAAQVEAQAAEQRKTDASRARQIIEAAAEGGELSYAQRLREFIGQVVAVNLVDPTKFVGVDLLSAQGDHFAVSDGVRIHRLPYRQLLRVTEGLRGEPIRVHGVSSPVPACLEVFHLVVYKGAVGVGLSVPIG